MWFIPILFVSILLLIVGFGLGVGSLLHWLIPTIDFGVASLIGVVTVVASASFVSRLTLRLAEVQEDEELQEFFREARRPFDIEIVNPVTGQSRRTRGKKRSRS